MDPVINWPSIKDEIGIRIAFDELAGKLAAFDPWPFVDLSMAWHVDDVHEGIAFWVVGIQVDVLPLINVVCNGEC